MDWAEKVRRAHPWRWRWIALKDKCRRAWHWVLDEPYWLLEENNDLVLRGLRTGRPCEEQED